MSGVLDGFWRLYDRAMDTRLARGYYRFSNQRGFLLAGGIAYRALFSMFAGLTIAWTAFMAVLGGNAGLRESVLDAIGKSLPGILRDDSGRGLISADQLVLDTAFNLTSVVATLVLAWSALATMTALKTSIRSMFGLMAPPENFVIGKARDAAGFLTIGVATVGTVILTSVAAQFSAQVLDFFKIDSPWAHSMLPLAGLVVAFLMDCTVFIMLIRVTSTVRAPLRDLLGAAATGSVASFGLRLGSTYIISSAAKNPLLAAASSVIVLLVWVNFLALITLLVCAIAANPPRAPLPAASEEVHFKETPNYVTLTCPKTLQWRHDATTGVIVPDETLNPDYVPPQPSGRWGGLIGRGLLALAGRLEARAERTRQSVRTDPNR